jgi:N-acetylmuramic acid 6-phosphate etherase
MRATNEKLIERARRIVMLAADIEYDRATQVLNEAKGVSKVAILMARCDLSRAEATALLADVRGHLDRAIAMASTRYPAPMVQQDGTPCP